MLKSFLCVISLLGLLAVDFSIAQAQETFPYVAQITANNTNLRAGQNKNFEVLSQLNTGDELIVVGESFDWRKVKLPLKSKAYINASYVKDLGDGIYQVKGNRLNVRALPSVNAAVLCQLKSGDLIRAVEKSNDWLKIEPPDPCYGWVMKENLAFKSKDVPAVRIISQAVLNTTTNKSVGQPGQISMIGVIEELADKTLSADIRHQIQNDGKTAYYLHGYRHIIDGFLNQKVRIEGRLEPDFRSDKPIVLVTKINLVL